MESLKRERSFLEKLLFAGFLIFGGLLGLHFLVHIPTFLESQTMSRTSRTRTDLKTMNIAIAAYRVDNGCIPSAVADLYRRRYLVGGPIKDPFGDRKSTIEYLRIDEDTWIVAGRGPDKQFDVISEIRMSPQTTGPALLGLLNRGTYDSTNGIVSRGDILLVGTASRKPSGH